MRPINGCRRPLPLWFYLRHLEGALSVNICSQTGEGWLIKRRWYFTVIVLNMSGVITDGTVSHVLPRESGKM